MLCANKCKQNTKILINPNFSEYYFSVDNLQKDFFLRRRMDEHGYLPLSLISSFPRVSQVTRDLNLIALSVMESEKVELDHTKMKVIKRKFI